jgi:hypothetical protein
MSTETDNAGQAQLIDRYLKWLDSDIKSQESYHDHKETMAWSATAAYLGVVLLSREATSYLDESTCVVRFFFSALIAVVAFAAFLFINMQFRARWKAADDVDAFRRIRTILSSFDSDEELKKKFSLSLGNTKIWPQFIEDEMKPTKWKKFQDIFSLKDSSKVLRERSELASYTVLFVATIIAILSVVFPKSDVPRLKKSEQQVERVIRALEEQHKAIKDVAGRSKSIEDKSVPVVVDPPNPTIRMPGTENR